MNGNGSAKAPALPPGYLGRPSSCLYDDIRWWLVPQVIRSWSNEDQSEGGEVSELFAFRYVNGAREEVQITNVSESVPGALDEPDHN
jgi:hypothetical protein